MFKRMPLQGTMVAMVEELPLPWKKADVNWSHVFCPLQRLLRLWYHTRKVWLSQKFAAVSTIHATYAIKHAFFTHFPPQFQRKFAKSRWPWGRPSGRYKESISSRRWYLCNLNGMGRVEHGMATMCKLNISKSGNIVARIKGPNKNCCGLGSMPDTYVAAEQHWNSGHVCTSVHEAIPTSWNDSNHSLLCH